MDNFARNPLSDWEQRLRSEAQASRPSYSAKLQERILTAIDACDSGRDDHQVEILKSDHFHAEMPIGTSRSARVRRSLAIAASLLAISTAGWWAAAWLASQIDSSTQTLAINDSEVTQRALAAADHWDLLDEDAQTAATWLVGELALDLDSPDATAADDADAMDSEDFEASGSDDPDSAAFESDES